MPDSKIMDAHVALTFADRSDPVIEALCKHMEGLIKQASEQAVAITLLEEGLEKLEDELSLRSPLEPTQ